MNGIKKFILEFCQRYDDFGNVDSYTSRYDGDDCSENVDNILKQIQDTFKYCKIPIEEDSSKTNPKCVKALKVLLLNTQFECHDNLTRDPLSGPVGTMNDVKMTRYLLLELVRRLKYEQILAESLLHMPLDLCLEILQIVIENIYIWEFDRGFDLVIAIILNCHKNLIAIFENGTQSCDLENKINDLINAIQQFMGLLWTDRFLRLFEVKNLEKSERIGIILEKITTLTYKCLSGCDKDAVSPEIAEVYRLRFGDDPIVRSERKFDDLLRALNEILMHTLLTKLEEIDRKCYDHWAQLEAHGNPSFSLQRLIRKNFNHFMEFLKDNNKLMSHKRLMTLMPLLETFNPLPVDIVSSLNLDELRYGSIEMKMDALRNLMPRYREWDHGVFDLIQRNRYLIDSNDISYLIDYLTLIMGKPGQQYHKRRVFSTIRRVLFHQQDDDDADWVMQPIDSSDDESEECPVTELNASWETASDESYDCNMKFDDLDSLDHAYDEHEFKSFIADGKDIKSPKYLKTTLSYLLYNPSNIIHILIAVIIGVPDYAHLSMLPEDLVFFFPVMEVGSSEMPLFLLEMGNVVTCYDIRDARKLIDLIYIMLNESKITANDFVKYVLVLLIENEPKDLGSYILVLKFVENYVFEKCTAPLDILPLIDGFIHRTKKFRRDLRLPRSVSDELFIQIRRTATLFMKKFEFTANYVADEFEPMDRLSHPFLTTQPALIHTSTLCLTSQINIGLLCFFGIDRARNMMFDECIQPIPDASTLSNVLFLHLMDDFLRYIMIKGTETEMVEFAVGLFKGESNNPDIRIKLNTIDNITRYTMASAIYLLEYPELNPPESFACLMRGLARYLGYVMTHIVEEFNMWQTSCQFRQNRKRMRQLCSCWTFLAYTLRTMRETIRHAIFYQFYEGLMATVDDPSMHNQPCGVALCKLRNALEKFSNDCLEIPHTEVRFDGPHSLRALDVKKKHKFIHECMNVPHYSNDGGSKYYRLCTTLKMWRDMKVNQPSGGN